MEKYTVEEMKNRIIDRIKKCDDKRVLTLIYKIIIRIDEK